MIPLWRALPPLAAAGAIGLAVDRALGGAFGTGAARWPLRCLFTVALGYLLLIGGWLVLPAVTLGVWLGRGGTRAIADDRRALVAAAVAIAAGVVVAAARPPDPLYWDSFVWLGKARLAARHVGALLGLSLTPGSPVIPAGYPILHAAATAWLGGPSDAPAAVAAGAAAFKLLSLALFATALAGGGARRATVALAVLLATPLWLVHLRAAYVDLPLGLLAAALLLVVRDGRSLVGAAVIAVVLTGAKDEGFAHVVAVTGVMLAGGDRPQRRDALAALGCAAATFALWHAALALHHVTPDHALAAPAAVAPLAAAIVVHLGDFLSWGALWPLALAAIVVVIARRGRAGDAVTGAAALAAQATLLAAAMVFGGERVRAFALAGTLINRLLVQLAPTAALLIAAVADPTQP